MSELVSTPSAAVTILVAEDEELIRMMMVDALQDEKFHVLEAHNGHAALEHFRRGNQIALLISDVGLPGLNGRELVEQARAIVPDLKFLFVTGYSPEILQHQGDADSQKNWIVDVPILRKPFDFLEFIEKVNTILRTEPRL